MSILIFSIVAFILGVVVALAWLKKMRASAEPKEEIQTTEEIILAHLKQNTFATRSDLLPLVKVSKATLVRVLDGLEKQGLVEQIGERKGARYRLSHKT